MSGSMFLGLTGFVFGRHAHEHCLCHIMSAVRRRLVLPPTAVMLLQQPEDAPASKGESWSERAKHFLRRDSFLRRAGSKGGAKPGNRASADGLAAAAAQEANAPADRLQGVTPRDEDDSSVAGASPKSDAGGAPEGPAARWAAFWAERNGSSAQQDHQHASGELQTPQQQVAEPSSAEETRLRDGPAAGGVPSVALPATAFAAKEQVMSPRPSSTGGGPAAAGADHNSTVVPASPRSDGGRGGFMAAVSGYVSRRATTYSLLAIYLFACRHAPPF